MSKIENTDELDPKYWDQPPSRWERFTAWIYYWGYWVWRLGGPF